MLIQFSFLMSSLCNQCHSYPKYYETVAEISANNDFEVDYFDEKSTESGNNVVSSVQLETENTKPDIANLVAGFQRVDAELVKVDEWSDTDTSRPILGKSAWLGDLNGHLKSWHRTC